MHKCFRNCPRTKDFLGNDGTVNGAAASGGSTVGGGAVIVESRGLIVTTVTVDNCKFVNNVGFGGGALELREVSADISRSRFNNNAALPLDVRGVDGNGGAINLDADTDARVTQSRFLLNSANSVGGAINSDGELAVENSFFTKNTADDGGAIFLRLSENPETIEEENVFFKNEPNNVAVGTAPSPPTPSPPPDIPSPPPPGKSEVELDSLSVVDTTQEVLQVPDVPANSTLTAVRGFAIVSQNDELLTVSPALDHLQSVGLECGASVSDEFCFGLTFQNNPRLTALTSLNELVTVNSTLAFSTNAQLETISGFDALTTISGALRVAGNDALETISSVRRVLEIVQRRA